MESRRARAVNLALAAALAAACRPSSGAATPTLLPLSIPRPTNTVPDPHVPTPSTDPGDELPALLEGVSSDRMMEDIAALSGIPTRHVHSPGIEQAADYIAAGFRRAGVEQVRVDGFRLDFHGVATEQRNVVAILQGRDSLAPAIVLGAHYDSRTADIDDALGPAPGANDNATGVAVLLEVARLLAARPISGTVYLVAFAAEETGLQGSRHFVEDGLPGAVAAMAAFDIVGNSSGPDGTDSLRVFSAGPDDSPSRALAHRIADLAEFWVPDLPVLVQEAIDRPGRYSDHVAFSEAGIPAVRFIEDGEHVEFQHNALDTLDRIDAAYLRRVTQLALVLAVTGWGDGPSPGE